MSTDFHDLLPVLERIAVALERMSNISATKPQPRKDSVDDERAALAVVAVARGATSFSEIADALGISRTTASRNPGIRRALESSVRDRRGGEAEEEYRWQA